MPTEIPQTPAAGAGISIYPEPCMEAPAFQIEGCRDALRTQLPDTTLLSLGRVVQVDVTLKNICPGKRVAATILLTEEGPDGQKIPRGAKHILVPAQEGTGCQDITLRCIPFSLPEALDPSGDTGSICGTRKFAAQVIANYTDTDFTCCEDTVVTV